MHVPPLTIFSEILFGNENLLEVNKLFFGFVLCWRGEKSRDIICDM